MSNLIAPGTPIGHYVVESLLAEGGMAVVYRARHDKLWTLHALKVLHLPTQAIQSRLMQEGKVQALLRHPNIVAVTDVVDVEGSPGLIMEFIEGPTLEQLLQAHRISLAQADALAEGILAGVCHAHTQGLIHRDLKPANVLLDATTSQGLTPKVTDFGLAKLLVVEGEGTGRTHSGMTMGTPSYMAPEQIRDAKNVDVRADVFSMGAILYDLYTGRQAFPGDIVKVFSSIASESYLPPRAIDPTLPERVVLAITGALKADRDARIPSCDELRRALRGGKVDEPLGTWADLLARVPPRDSVPLAARSVISGVQDGGTWHGATPKGAPPTTADPSVESSDAFTTDIPTVLRPSSNIPAELSGSIAPTPAMVPADDDLPEWRPRRPMAAKVALAAGAGIGSVLAATLLVVAVAKHVGATSAVSTVTPPPTVTAPSPAPATKASPAPASQPAPQPVVAPPSNPKPDPTRPKPQPKPVQTPAPVETPVPAPAPPAPVSPAPVPATSVPEPSVATPPAPAQPPPPTVTLRVTNWEQMKTVVLTNRSTGAKVRLTGNTIQVDPGSYDAVLYTLAGPNDPITAGSVRLEADTVWTVNCSGTLGICKVEPEP